MNERTSRRLKEFTFRWSMALAMFLVVVLLWNFLSAREERRLQAGAHASALQYLSAKRAEIEQQINRRLFPVRGLAALVATSPKFTAKEFDATAAALLEGQDGIRALQLAPNGVISFIHPLTGNEAALGKNLLTDPERGPAARRAMVTRQFFLAGPFKLYQGGYGLVGRIPMFRDSVFWGFSQVVVDYDALLRSSGLTDTTGPYEFALRGLDELGEHGAVFFGRNELFHEDPELTRIALASGSWQLAAIPKGGWGAHSRIPVWFWLSGVIIACLAGMLAYMGIQRWQWLRTELETTKDVWRYALEGAGDGVWDWRIPEDKVTYSLRWKEMLGYRDDEIQDSTEEWPARVHPDDYPRIQHCLDEYIRGEAGTYAVEYRMRAKDGSYKWLLGRGKIISRTSDGRPLRMIGTHADITNVKLAEEALRESEQRYRRFFENDLTGDFIVDAQGKILDCNPAFARIFGYSTNHEAIGGHLGDVCSDADQPPNLVEAVRRDRKLEYLEMVMKHRSGRSVHVVANLFGVFDREGNFLHAIGFVFDDTGRKTAEQSLLQGQKLESIGTLAGGIAHDFNNLLSIIIGHGTILSKIAGQERVTQSANIILKTAERGASLVRQILTFARKTEVKVKPVRVNQMIGDLVQLLGETFPKTITFSLQLEQSLPTVAIDETQLHQALLNLCTNARDAMQGKGTLTVTTCLKQPDEVSPPGSAPSNRPFVSIVVSDTGEGMDQSTRDRIFEPFFTTKREKGTGLGLAVVYGIVHQHGGYIDVQSERGTGSSISLFFPVTEEKPDSTTTSRLEETSGVQGSERILVVEDEPLLLELSVNVLTEAGYRVTFARNGEEGIEKIRSLAGRIDLIITDMGLPRVDGMELLTTARHLYPGVRFLVVTGFLEPEVRTRLDRLGPAGVLIKPYSPMEFLSKVRSVFHPTPRE